MSTAMLTAGLPGLAMAQGQAPAPAPETPPAPTGSVPASLPTLRLPELSEIQLALPRPVRAAQASLGLGRQRLALVVGLGNLGSRAVVDSAPRDAEAVATALRSGGFVVMQRSDVSAAELRMALKEFRERLQPGAVGFVYVTGLGVQVNGDNLLLAREAPLDAAAAPAQLTPAQRAAAVPLEELSDALAGPMDSPRLLVVDAAYRHPALAGLAQPGLAEPRLPSGMMALFGHALGSVKEVPAVAPLPLPVPTDAVALAATPFARTLVAALLTPRISGAEALRQTRRLLAETSLGQAGPWLGGDTDAREEFAEATLLDGLVPRTPEELAREGARQGSRLISRADAARAGELPVSEVLRQPTAADEDTRRPNDKPRKPLEPGSGGSGGSGLGGVAGQAVGVLGTAAGVAATVAGGAAVVKAAELAVAVSAVSTAAGAATSVLGTATALAAKATAGGAAAAVPATVAAPTTPISPSTPALTTAPTPTVATLPAPAATAVPVAAPAAPLPAVAPTAAATAGAADAPSTMGLRAAQAALSQAAPNAGDQQDPSATDGRTQRTAGRGERPAYTPRSNPFGYAEGDTFTYQVTDTWKGEVVRQYTTAIEEVMGDGALRANGQQLQMDAQGRVTRRLGADGSESLFEPAQALWWARPEAGERRIVKYLEKFRRADRASGQTEWKGSARVGRLRKIETPAGEFEVLPVESSGWWYQKMANGTLSSGQWSRTAYYAPKLGHPVAIEFENADHLGRLLKRERIDLLHAQTARGAP